VNLVKPFASLNQCFIPEGTLAADAPSLKCNDVSLALLIRYGATRVILGGDVERRSWEQILKAVHANDLRAQGVKVSHHGSRTGYCTDLWEVFSQKGKPVAVITPSLKHRLPNRDAVDHIQKHAAAIYVTCPRAVTFRGVRYEFPPRYTPEQRAAFRDEMSLFRRVPSRLGICSLSFNSQGESPKVTVREGARRITI
jgi:hypothetical protein